MADIVFVRVVWDRTSFPLRLPGVRLMSVHVGPEPGWPFGRKGLALAGAWAQLATPADAGMLLLDGDVAVDPYDVGVMLTAIGNEPHVVHVAPVKLWPASTMRPTWHWGHHRGTPTQELCPDPTQFSFCFTYLPRPLIERCIKAGLKSWTFPRVDQRVSEQFKASGLPIRVVEDCHPKHLNF